MNKIIIHGRLTRDPELKQSNNGVNYANFTVAVDRAYKTQSGEKQTDFFDCTAWRKTGEIIADHFKKGQEIVVCGAMESRKYMDDNGINRVFWGITVDNFDFCGNKKDNELADSGSPFTELDSDDGGDLPF